MKGPTTEVEGKCETDERKAEKEKGWEKGLTDESGSSTIHKLQSKAH